jgi:hypothetical protein
MMAVLWNSRAFLSGIDEAFARFRTAIDPAA